MRTSTELAKDYIDLWNERDAARRRALLTATWAADATYADPLMRGSGLDEIDGLIAAVQQRFPSFRFSPLTPADGHGDVARFSWALGPAEGDAVVKGTDFVRRNGDLIASVTGFLDEVPADT
jgi:SnoaL-like domain